MATTMIESDNAIINVIKSQPGGQALQPWDQRDDALQLTHHDDTHYSGATFLLMLGRPWYDQINLTNLNLVDTL